MPAEEIQEIVKAYVAAWSEPDETARRRLLERTWTDDGAYTDRLQHVEGREALMQAMGTFQQRRPSERFILTSGVDHHHGMLRFTWRWLAADGSTVMDGLDFGKLASDGRLRKIVGFFGQLSDPNG